MPKRPCPYEDCRCREVDYWGWYERKEGSIPLGEWEVAGAIPIRRFRCSVCGRTFSWRPPFLVFGRRYAAVAYQQAFKDWALGRRRPGGAWFLLDLAARKSFRRLLAARLDELRRRLGAVLYGRRSPSRDEDRPWLWFLARRRLRERRHVAGGPRLSVHLIALALARHPEGAEYCLESP